MRMLHKTIFILLVLINHNSIAQLRAPTDLELKAAYCMTIVGHYRDVNQTAKTLTANAGLLDFYDKQIAEFEGREKKVLSYLAINIGHIKPLGLAVAMASAKDDITKIELDNELNSCIKSCSNDFMLDRAYQKFEQCYNKCVLNNDRMKKMRSCWDLTWLPF